MNTQNTNLPTAPADDEMLNDIRYSKAQQVAESPPLTLTFISKLRYVTLNRKKKTPDNLLVIRSLTLFLKRCFSFIRRFPREQAQPRHQVLPWR